MSSDGLSDNDNSQIVENQSQLQSKQGKPRKPSQSSAQSTQKKEAIDVTSLKEMKFDESLYARKKKISPKQELQQTEEELEEQALKSIELVSDYLQKLEKEERTKVISMKLKYPKKFCVIHQDLFDSEAEYQKHMIRNHKLLAKKEGLIKFHCENCGDVYQTHGKFTQHENGCTGMKKYLQENKKLTPRQKRLVKLSAQLKYAKQ